MMFPKNESLMYAVTESIKANGLINLITKQTITKIKKHLNNPYAAPRKLSTNLTNPISRSFLTKSEMSQTSKYKSNTDVTNEMIVTKNDAYDSEMI